MSTALSVTLVFSARQHIYWVQYMIWQFWLSICPSICRTHVLYENGWTYHQTNSFTIWWAHHSSFASVFVLSTQLIFSILLQIHTSKASRLLPSASYTPIINANIQIQIYSSCSEQNRLQESQMLLYSTVMVSNLPVQVWFVQVPEYCRYMQQG